MLRLLIIAWFGAALAIMALGCFLAGDDVLALLAPGSLGQRLGWLLMAGAMVAAGLVFRSAFATPKISVAPAPRPGGEFRRGFAHERRDLTKQQRPSPRTGIVALSSAAETHTAHVVAPSAPKEIEILRLQAMLRDRALAMHPRGKKQATPRS